MNLKVQEYAVSSNALCFFATLYAMKAQINCMMLIQAENTLQITRMTQEQTKHSDSAIPVEHVTMCCFTSYRIHRISF